MTAAVPSRGYSIGTHTPGRSYLGRLLVVVAVIGTSSSPTAPARGSKGRAASNAPQRLATYRH